MSCAVYITHLDSTSLDSCESQSMLLYSMYLIHPEKEETVKVDSTPYQTLCIPSQYVLNKKPTQMLLNMPSAPENAKRRLIIHDCSR